MSSTGNKEIGSRLLSLRTKLTFSQQVMADSIGISLKTYQNYERGDRSITKESICTLMDKYELDPSWLLSGKPKESNETSATASIDITLLAEVAYDFEIAYKSIVEKNETAEWMNFYDSSLEQAESEPRPKDEEIQLVCNEVSEKAKLVSLVGHIYNAVINEDDEKERRKIIKQNATIGLMLSDPSTDTSKVFKYIVNAHTE